MRSPEIHDIEVRCLVLEGESRSAWELVAENTAFSINLKRGDATFLFKYPLSSLDYGEQKVDEFLRSWEADVLFQTGRERRRFRISGSSAPGHGCQTYVYGQVTIGGRLAEENTRRKTPWKRHRYWDIPLVDSLIQRYEEYRCGHERLTVLGFLCLSALSHAFDGRKALANRLNFDDSLLSELGRLVSTVGTHATARKISRDHDLRELTPLEEYWLESVTRELIRRAGEAYNGRIMESRCSLSDFPSLPLHNRKPQADG